MTLRIYHSSDKKVACRYLMALSHGVLCLVRPADFPRQALGLGSATWYLALAFEAFAFEAFAFVAQLGAHSPKQHPEYR
jgi:hypothetical protein